MTIHRTPEQIAADIDEVRGRMDATLDEIEHRLNVRRMVREGLDELRNTGIVRSASAMASSAGRSARDHPVPAALTGAGLLGLIAWGVIAGSHARHERRARRDVSDAVQAARQRLQSARRSLTGGSSTAGRRVIEAGSDALQHVGEVGSEAREMVRQHPMAAGAVGLALLALALAATPAVRHRIGL
jgi:hypothetical protein